MRDGPFKHSGFNNYDLPAIKMPLYKSGILYSILLVDVH
ncbi:hypothetical protein FM109_16930 [Vibrio casei]|nr:hypothetical protein FM109_16930 [Vibrio casei]